MKSGVWSRLSLHALALACACSFVWAVLSSKDGQCGWVRVAPDEVAVVSDHLRGSTRVVSSPGLLFVRPWFQEVTLLERAPTRLRLRAAEQGPTDLEPLRVRASDGTNFHFDDLTLVHRLVPEQAARVLRDSGAQASGRSRLVRALARGVLRDELGRGTVEALAAGEPLDGARQRARTRLNAALAPHGIVLEDLPTAMPRFDADYEEQLLRRRVAEQKIGLVRAERKRLVSEVEHRLLRVRRKQETQRQVLRGELEVGRVEAERRAIVRAREADLEHLRRVEQARVARVELEAQAEARRNRYASEAEGLAERVRAATVGGERGVREAWIRTLSGGGAVDGEVAGRNGR